MPEFNNDCNKEKFDVPENNVSSHDPINGGIPCHKNGYEFWCHRRIDRTNDGGLSLDELNDKILKIKVHIAEKFPELSKLLDEMPLTAPENGCSTVCFYDLNEYYNSLEAILIKYKLEHPKS